MGGEPSTSNKKLHFIVFLIVNLTPALENWKEIQD